MGLHRRHGLHWKCYTPFETIPNRRQHSRERQKWSNTKQSVTSVTRYGVSPKPIHESNRMLTVVVHLRHPPQMPTVPRLRCVYCVPAAGRHSGKRLLRGRYLLFTWTTSIRAHVRTIRSMLCTPRSCRMAQTISSRRDYFGHERTAGRSRTLFYNSDSPALAQRSHRR